MKKNRLTFLMLSILIAGVGAATAGPAVEKPLCSANGKLAYRDDPKDMRTITVKLFYEEKHYVAKVYREANEILRARLSFYESSDQNDFRETIYKYDPMFSRYGLVLVISQQKDRTKKAQDSVSFQLGENTFLGIMDKRTTLEISTNCSLD